MTGQRDTPVTLLSGDVFGLDYVGVSSSADSFANAANRPSSLSYVDPQSFSCPLPLEITHRVERDIRA